MIFNMPRRLMFAVPLTLLLATPGGEQGLAAPLPAGASSLKESYQDWQVACLQSDGADRCAMTQIQADPKSGKRVITFEMQLPRDGARATLVVPFGLALGKGITLRVDDGEAWPTLAFSTCLPVGCLVSTGLSTAQLEKLRTGMALTVGATANGNGQALDFTVSLNGFSAAFSRLRQLSED